MDGNKCVIYARYSSEKQTEQSIEGQLTICNKYIKDNNLTLINTYIDRALTGRSDHRADFQRMIRDSANMGFNYVIVYKLDRFARSRYDSAFYKSILKKNGVKLISATENITDAPEGIILEALLEGMAEYYSAELAQKVKRGMSESLNKRQYLGGTVPFGFDSKDKRLVINEAEAIIVKEMFNKFSQGLTAKEIVTWLKDCGVKNKTGNYFGITTLMHILNNKKYIGTFTYNNTEYKNYFPQIVTEKVFNMVNKRIEKNKRMPAHYKSKQDYLLSGKLYCGNCKSLMTADTGTSRTGDVYNYYKCFNKKKNRTACNKSSVPKDWLEDLVVSATLEYIFNENTYKQILTSVVKLYNNEIADNKELDLLIKDKTKYEQEVNNLMKAIKLGVITKSTQQELERLENEIEELDVKILKLQSYKKEEINEDMLDFYLRQFKKINNNSDKERLIDAFINKVYLYDDKIVIIYNCSEDNEKTIKINPEDIINASGGSESSNLIQSGQPRRSTLLWRAVFY